MNSFQIQNPLYTLGRKQGPTVLFGAVLALLHFSFVIPACSQNLDAFNPGASNAVYSLAVQADGKILVGGSFTALGGQARSRIGRVHTDGTVDASFNPGASSTVFALAAQGDGKILVGGQFSLLGGQSRRYIGRLNEDGTVDATFNPAANSYVYCLAVQEDGKILLGGRFTTLGGQSRKHIARLNSDGTLDSSFNPGANDYVYSLALQADGKILLGGEFTNLGGEGRRYIGRLNQDGSLDLTFNPTANNYVLSLALQEDGQILVGGRFTSIGGQRRSRIARLASDGSLDNTFNPGANNYVYCLAVQTDGKILAGGVFSSLAGQALRRIGRLNFDGTADVSFNAAANSNVYALALQRDGKVIAGGAFRVLGGQPRAHIGRLENTEPATESLTLDNSTLTWLRGGTGPEVWRTTFQYFTNPGWAPLGVGTRITNGWRLDGVSVPLNATISARGYTTSGQYNGSSWFVEATVGKLAIFEQPTGSTNNAGTTAALSVYAGGTGPLTYQWRKGAADLSNGGNVSGATTPTVTLSNVLAADAAAYSVVIANPQGSITSAVATLTVIDPALNAQPMSQNINIGEDVTFSVAAAGTPPLTYQWRKDGALQFGATSSSLTLTNIQLLDAAGYDVLVSNPIGTVTSSVAVLRVNLALPDTFNPGTDGSIYSLAVQRDGKILAGGNFTVLAGQSRSNIARLNAEGTQDGRFNPGADGPVISMALQPDGKILVAGNFAVLGGQSRTNLGRLNEDGTLDADFNAGADGPLSCVALQADGKIIVGGSFESLAGQSITNLGRLNPDGTLDFSFNPAPDGRISSLALQADGKILVGGSFTALAGQNRALLGRLNVDGTADLSFDPQASGSILSIAVQPDGQILVVGFLDSLAGQSVTNLGRLNSDGSLDFTFGAWADDSVNSMVLQANGKILVGGEFVTLSGQSVTGLGRLNADGSLDNAFIPAVTDAILFQPFIYCLAVQPNGEVLAGGTFTRLAGQDRAGLARLNNTEPATESLSFNGSTITWLLSGASPEVWRTTFAASTNGLSWMELGPGVRALGSWQLSGLSFPATATILARGYTVSGLQNASGWFVEQAMGAPVFLNQPLNQVAGSGHSASFTPAVAGSLPLTCQWFHNGLAIASATNSSYVIPTAQSSDAGSYFVVVTNANGSVTSAVAVLQVTNPPASNVAARGAYNGLFFQPSGVAQATSGYFRLNMGSKRKFSAFVLIGKVRYSMTGRFDSAGHATATARAKHLSSLSVDLQIDSSSGGELITGTVSGTGWKAQLTGYRATSSTQINSVRQAGRYTMTFPGNYPASGEPNGDSYATVLVSRFGIAHLTGTLADGTRIQQAAALSSNGVWPLYVSLYSGHGSILGWITFADTPAEDLSGAVNWIKQASSKTKIYPAGFTNQTLASGSRYQRPSGGQSPLALPTAELILYGGNLSHGITNQITLGSRNPVTSGRTSLTFSPSSGLFMGRLADSSSGASISFSGVVLQKKNSASGFFLEDGRSGRALLSSP